jgi:hypothetical protein
MATMIPPLPAADAPGSEKRVFYALKAAPGTEKWTILHSLGISSGWTGEFGEIDFVLIIPEFGVLCAEVKGGRVTQKDGTWFTRRFGSTVQERLKRSPFSQAQKGMWKLDRALDLKFGAGSWESRCPIGWIVILPDVDCPPVTPEFTRDEVIDQRDMAADFVEKIRNAPSLVHLSERHDLCPPTAATCRRLLSFLRPDFDRIIVPATSILETERRILALTEEQYGVLDAIADNQVCIVKGPAGTGKTNIGMEAARRLSLQGKRVLLACFNKNLGHWLRKYVDEQGLSGIVAGHMHALLRDRISSSSFADELPAATGEDDADLYGRIYFDLGALAIEEANERFDAVIIDEAQDFEPERLADVLKAFTGGAVDARTILLGDFTRQALYGKSADALERLRSAFAGAPTFGLSINCRNTRRIATQTDLMCGFTGTKVSEKQVDGDSVEVFFEASDDAAVARAAHIVTVLRTAGYPAQDVVLLGHRRRENSSVKDSNAIGGWRLRDTSSAGAGELAYSTIHSFKGLERPVVIVIDAGASGSDETDSLLYVAMSRARVRLFVICPEDARGRINQRITDWARAQTMAGAK